MTAHFFFNDTATTEIYTLSLHDALPICEWQNRPPGTRWPSPPALSSFGRSEEHTSELQSRPHLVCRLLLEKKKIFRFQYRKTKCRQPHKCETKRRNKQ